MRGIKSKEQGKWKRVSVFFGLFLLLFILLNSVRNVYQKKLATEEALSRMENEAKELTDRNEFLKKSMDRIATQEGIEFEIRKKLNMAEVGESVAIIVERGETAPAQNPKISAWQKVKNFFGWLFE